MSDGRAYSVRVSRRFEATVTVWSDCGCEDCLMEELRNRGVEDDDFEDPEGKNEITFESKEEMDAHEAYSDCDEHCSDCGYKNECDHSTENDEEADCYECGDCYCKDDMYQDDNGDWYCESCWNKREDSSSEKIKCPNCGSTRSERSCNRDNPGCEDDRYCNNCGRWYNPHTGWSGYSTDEEREEGKKWLKGQQERPPTSSKDDEVPEYIRQMLES